MANPLEQFKGVAAQAAGQAVNVGAQAAGQAVNVGAQAAGQAVNVGAQAAVNAANAKMQANPLAANAGLLMLSAVQQGMPPPLPSKLGGKWKHGGDGTVQMTPEAAARLQAMKEQQAKFAAENAARKEALASSRLANMNPSEPIQQFNPMFGGSVMEIYGGCCGDVYDKMYGGGSKKRAKKTVKKSKPSRKN